MTLPEFVAKWKAFAQKETSGAQQHFLDLCELLAQPKPADVDPTGESYTFEKGAEKNVGGDGFADVWRRGYFAIEYKGKKKDLKAAYKQILEYREALASPPLLAVCNLDRFEVHTNFTGTVPDVYAFNLDELLAGVPTPTCKKPPLDVLRALFTNPETLRPTLTTSMVTEKAAETFSRLAGLLVEKDRGNEPHAVAQFLIRLLFCLFAEDVGLLPSGLFTRILDKSTSGNLTERLSQLFVAMADGGDFMMEDIKHFNGGLFTDGEALELQDAEIKLLREVAKLDWSAIEPSIFGTLFERSLDPSKRSQLGAHYTSRADIELIVEPVVLVPLRRRWEEVRASADAILSERNEKRAALEATLAPGTGLSGAQRNTIAAFDTKLYGLLKGFTDELAGIRVLDPACGSGNFLYVALRALLDLEKSVISYALGTCGLSGFFPSVGPEQMLGLELNEYAASLAPVTVWIGYIQWLRDNGFGEPAPPILRSMDQIKEGDAVLNPDGSEPDWPAADFLIGNPPFLGDRVMRGELGDAYTDALRKLYRGRVEGGADLVTYWFEKARALVETGVVKRAGLISTNSIRFGANRKVLEKIATGGGIFAAWPDNPWILNGAAVRVSLVCFDDGSEPEPILDGKPVPRIHPDLTAAIADVTTAVMLPENVGLSFLGMMKAGPFDLDSATAKAMILTSGNPNGRPNSDIVKPRLGAQDITGHSKGGFVIDFGVELSEEDAALYEAPFEYVREHVKPLRDESRRNAHRVRWWRFGDPRPGLRCAIANLPRFIVTPEVSKHRVFVWMQSGTIPDHSCHAIARADDYFFGVLHSRVHEVWSLALGNRMGVGNDPRYNSSKTFGTFPMPWPPGSEPGEADSPLVAAIGQAARKLVELRGNVLDAPGSTETLTGLYNKRPSWLDNAHKALDRAVLAAYADVTGETWPESLSDDELLGRLLAINHQRTERPLPFPG